jgi:hypothetical protein
MTMGAFEIAMIVLMVVAVLGTIYIDRNRK